MACSPDPAHARTGESYRTSSGPSGRNGLPTDNVERSALSGKKNTSVPLNRNDSSIDGLHPCPPALQSAHPAMSPSPDLTQRLRTARTESKPKDPLVSYVLLRVALMAVIRRFAGSSIAGAITAASCSRGGCLRQASAHRCQCCGREFHGHAGPQLGAKWMLSR
jgi:hypothetical protein